jgi:hypothetical protein
MAVPLVRVRAGRVFAHPLGLPLTIDAVLTGSLLDEKYLLTELLLSLAFIDRVSVVFANHRTEISRATWMGTLDQVAKGEAGNKRMKNAKILRVAVRKPVARRMFLTLMSLLAFSSPAAAEAFHAKIFGHDVTITKSSDDQNQLAVDKKAVFTDDIMGISEIALVDGIGVAIGYSGSGGNSCAGSYFVLSFPKDQPVRVDGPTGNCFAIEYSIQDKLIRFKTDASITRAGETWEWTPSNGMSERISVPFRVDAASNVWDDLRSRRLSDPGELFKYDVLNSRLTSLLGTEAASALPIINGVGNIEFKGEVVVATSCAPHQCDETGSIIAIDLPRRALFLAWKPSNGAIVVRPPVKDWSPSARSELSAWSRRWTRKSGAQ